jgi:carboxylate-amine ligase
VAYFRPHLLALSTSAAFSGDDDTGQASYRLAVFDEMPRTDLLGLFGSWVRYERHVNTLVKTRVMQDTIYIWRDL